MVLDFRRRPVNHAHMKIGIILINRCIITC